MHAFNYLRVIANWTGLKPSPQPPRRTACERKAFYLDAGELPAWVQQLQNVDRLQAMLDDGMYRRTASNEITH